MDDEKQENLTYEVSREGALLIAPSGTWSVRDARTDLSALFETIAHTPPASIAFDCSQLKHWDSSLLAFILKLMRQAKTQNIPLALAKLPKGLQQLIHLATAVPAKAAEPKTPPPPWIEALGEKTQQLLQASLNVITFVGEISLSLVRLVKQQARFMTSDLLYYIQTCSAQALGIVSLISLLVGLILAFVAAIQLEQFGAQIYVANLVGVGMAREMAPIMTGIIMAGRTGAAYAAQLGTMQVNEEIDALTTCGINAIDFLVLPRILALIIMMPLLTAYADVLGMIGGAIVAGSMLDISLTQYMNQMQTAVTLNDLYIGLFKGAVFGVLVAIAGCLRGMQCGRSAQSVGLATTSAVVTGIVFIIAADAIIAVMLHMLEL